MSMINKILSLVRSKKLRDSIWKFMIMQALIIVLIVSILSYFSANTAMQKQVVSFSGEILKIKANDVDNYIEDMERQSQYILQQLSVYAVLDKVSNLDKSNPYFDIMASGIMVGTDNDQLDILLDTMVTRREIQSVAILDNEGVIWAYDNYGSSSIEIQTILDIDTISKLMDISNSSESGLEAYLYDDNSDEKVLFFTRCIYSPEDYKKVGYLVLIANTDSLASIISSGIDDEGFNIAVYSDNDKPVYIGGNDISSNHIEEFIDKNISWQVNKKEEVLFVRALTQREGWSLVSSQRLDILFHDILRYRQLIFALSVIIMSVLVLASWRFASDIVRPISAVTEAMQRVRAGETDVDVVIDRNDEIGYMSETFNTMVDENKRLVNDIYREQITKQEAELQAMQSQINPHFLFNTLEAISWKARLSKVDDISEMVEDLSDIMRSSIGKNSSMTQLCDEIKYIKKYLDIMKRRFEDRLAIKINIDESLNDYLIPRLLIQPLIENAIYHGIERMRQGGIIFVGAKVVGDKTIINVCNTGNGLPKDVVDKINGDLRRGSDEYFYSLQSNQSKNVGLENANRRIKLSYGEEYGIQLVTKVGYYLNVIMTLPEKQSRKGDINK